MTVPDSKTQKIFGTAVILAGGKSLRMGFDKQFLRIDDIRIMDELISKLEEEFAEIIIVTNRPEEYGDYKHRIVKDIIVGKGPLSGIHVGLKESSSNYVFIVACDMPNVNLDYIKYMKKTILNKDIHGCITCLGDNLEPFHGFYSRKIISEIERNLEKNRRSVTKLIEDLDFIKIRENEARKFSPDWDMFLNLNKVEDIESYKIKL